MKAKKSILSTLIAASMLVMLTGCDVRTILPSSTTESSDSESVSAPASEESSIAETSDGKTSVEESPANVYEYDIQDDGSIIITKYIGNESVVEIPSTINGRRVTLIGFHSFSACNSITSITIPSGIEYLGEYAFFDCVNLTSITIPNSVTSIRANAFSNCTSLTKISIPNSVTYIGYEAFSGCSKLTDLIIPYGITSLSGTFLDCKSLKSVVVPNSVNVIGDRTFSGCYSLKLITIPDSVTEISDYAFEDSDPFVTYRGKTYAAYEYEDLYKAINYGSSQPETPVVKRKTFTFNTLTGSIYGLDFLVGYPDYDEVDNYLAQGKTPKYINVDVYYQCPGCFRETFCSRVKFSYSEEEAQMVTNIHCDNPRCSHYNENSSALLCSNIKN